MALKSKFRFEPSNDALVVYITNERGGWVAMGEHQLKMLRDGMRGKWVAIPDGFNKVYITTIGDIVKIEINEFGGITNKINIPVALANQYADKIDDMLNNPQRHIAQAEANEVYDRWVKKNIGTNDGCWS